MFLHCKKVRLETSFNDHRERTTPQQLLWGSVLLNFFFPLLAGGGRKDLI